MFTTHLWQLHPVIRIQRLVVVVTLFLTRYPDVAAATEPNPQAAAATASAATGAVHEVSESGVTDVAGHARIAGLHVPAGVEVRLVATYPQLESPVAICVDSQNRLYAAEVHRFNRGTEENRNRTFLLAEDLQASTVDDRLAAYRRYADRFEGGMSYFQKYSDRVVRLVDLDGDGDFDRKTIFADRFNDPLAGLGAGLISGEKGVWYTNIPDLWYLEDRDDDGVAERRRSIAHGFGVQNAFLGHDLHGLAWGPDGKVYFSVGDRGYHVETPDGRVFHGPRHGAIFRCQPDGSEFEVVFTGLRNPQEIAFDDEGNLFTADNNCDKGDSGRLVYVVEGGHAGWNMAYQTIADPYLTGPWHAEGIWHVPPCYRDPNDNRNDNRNDIGTSPEEQRWHDLLIRNHNSQPAWIVPPVGAVGSGPAGFVCHPGGTLLADWAGQLLLCNYVGSGGLEGIRIQHQGAGFRIRETVDLCKPISATDVEFTYDGRVLLSDYVGLNWDGSTAGGRIYSLSEKDWPESGRALVEVAALRFDLLSAAQLGALLDHSDRRIRQRAQFSLAEGGAVAETELIRIARDPRASLPARRHALWGLGQRAVSLPVARTIQEQLASDEPTVRAQAIRASGWQAARWSLAGKKQTSAPLYDATIQSLVAGLRDSDPYLQSLAAESLGKWGDVRAVEPLFQLLQENADHDPILRHTICYALYRLNATDIAAGMVGAEHRSQRLGAVLILRHAQDARLSQFLNDVDIEIATEAARAIHDVPLLAQFPALAAIGTMASPSQAGATVTYSDAFDRRVINACLHLGDAPQVEQVLQIALDPRRSLAVRGEALAALQVWCQSETRDRVTGAWHPRAARDPARVQGLVARPLSTHWAELPAEIRAQGVQLLQTYGITPAPELVVACTDPQQQPIDVRAAAVALIGRLPVEEAQPLLERAASDPDDRVRSESFRALVRLAPAAGVTRVIDIALNASDNHIRERQVCLQELATPFADAAIEAQAVTALAHAVTRWEEQDWPTPLMLDLMQAVQSRPDLLVRIDSLQQRLTQAGIGQRWQHLLVGGDAARGKLIYFNNSRAQCVRCHQIGLDGGIAGPKLEGLNARYPVRGREYFLESLLEPSARFAQGYEQTLLELDDGRVISGTVTKESDDELAVRQGDGTTLTVAKATIESRTAAQSLMPKMGDSLQPSEVRDLIEFLSTL